MTNEVKPAERTPAAVIDPSVLPDVYVDLAGRHGWRIRHVLDTHIHADHLSRARQLVERTAATLWLPGSAARQVSI